MCAIVLHTCKVGPYLLLFFVFFSVSFKTHVCLIHFNSVFYVIVIHSFGILIGACVIFKQLFSSK